MSELSSGFPLTWNREEAAGLADPPLARILALNLQRAVGWFLLLPFAGLLVFLMRFVGGYRIEDRARLRREFRELTRERAPLLVCANHLTFIDSALIIWAFGSNPWYLTRFRAFSWNLPAGDFFKKKLRYRLVAFLTKCIFIHRDGSKAHKDSVLSLCRYLLRKGEVVSVFPEGKRSRLGRFDRRGVAYGPAKILSTLPGCRVLCVYIRSRTQESYSNYPPKGSSFRLLTRVIVPRTEAVGRLAYSELTDQIADNLMDLERQYFEGSPS